MPIYEFHCDSCDCSFEKMTAISARDEKVECPACSSRKTGRKLSVVAVGTGAAKGTSASSSGHTHTGMCGCGKRQGSCGMN